LRLCAFAPLRLCAFAPLRLCAFAPLRLCAFAPLRLCEKLVHAVWFLAKAQSSQRFFSGLHSFCPVAETMIKTQCHSSENRCKARRALEETAQFLKVLLQASRTIIH
jgi:hypothetical protein